MLAQWVPLHAVSCSNLIETGGCAESREIPLRVTQACSECCSRDYSLSLFFSFERTFFRPFSREPLADPTDGDCSAECSMCSTIAPPHIRA